MNKVLLGLIATPVVLAISACSKGKGSLDDLTSELPAFSAAEAETARQEVAQLLNDGQTIIAVCGPSSGASYVADFGSDDWAKDGISNGRLVFVTGANGTADIFFKDATGRFMSAISDGGIVTLLNAAPNGSDFSIVVSYETGVVEAHQITTDPGVGRLDAWTSSKPVVVGPATARAFVSRCY